jgi:acetoin utilization deacetylase AcuC-like enzyme
VHEPESGYSTVKTVYSDAHLQHAPVMELAGNRFVPTFELPVRAESIRARVAAADLGPVIVPRDFGRQPIEAVHAPDYVAFLEYAWRDWLEAGGEGDVMSFYSRMADMSRHVPRSIFGRIAHYSFDSTSTITAGTWQAVYAGAQVALTGAELIERGERTAFALCRPPGHHASRDYCGGYCYLNNAAIAAQSLIAGGSRRVAILDVDYHHGNGTQSIFYARDDVLFVSIHADPHEEYPYFTGHADETGEGAGAGFNLNLPLPLGTEAAPWFAALSNGLERIRQHAPDALVASLGVDTFVEDPISQFRLQTNDYLRLGERIAGLAVPTLFVMEGGYALDAIADNVVNVLQGAGGGNILNCLGPRGKQ